MLISMLILILVVLLTIYWVRKMQYEKTEYFMQTKRSYLSLNFDIGCLGEYYTYKQLKSLKGCKKFLFNVYIPKDDGQTTELDVILLHESGIYVFESKNYSGWIFGAEEQPYWTQTLSTGKKGKSHKSRFYNPIMQNKGHIKYLYSLLQDQTIPMYSYIVFSNHCTLKKISLTSGNHHVINRYNILREVKTNILRVGTHLSPEKIDQLYNKLYPLTQVDATVKQQHVADIKEKHPNSQCKTKPKQQHGEKKENYTSEKCPLCGSNLVVRVATNGNKKGTKFLGCSNYPKCHYMRDLS